ncbi:MAG: DinB family protein [Planctomycetes bacterium]|nr:DinB family protein [Planctomycetota bacterium]
MAEMSFIELLQKLQSQVESLIGLCDASGLEEKNDVSQWSALSHLEHLSVTGKSTPLLIETAFDSDTAACMNDDGKRLFSLGYFPRGETQSPDFAIPKGIKINKIRNNFSRLQKQLAAFESREQDFLVCQKGAEHPFLGYLKPRDWLHFLFLHQTHHLGILKEILG